MDGYTESHKILGQAFSLDGEGVMNKTGVSYRTFSFTSEFTQHLPAAEDLPVLERDYLSASPDNTIPENINFRYPVFLPEGYKQTNRAIILLHGLNEKSWDKYLPWARELVLRTGML